MVAIRSELRHDLRPTVGDLRLDVVEHHPLRLLVQHDLAARGKEGEAPFDVALESSASAPRESPELRVPAELLVLVAHEVEHREDCLVAGAAQSAAELLEENGRALSWSQ